MWYPVRSVGLCTPLYLYQCCVCGILFVPLVCYTFIFVLVLCMWYPVRSVGSCCLLHLYICTSVVYVVSCSFRWFVSPLYLYQCCVCGITFIFVLVLCMWYPVRSVGSCHLYICMYVVSCSFRWFVHLYICTSVVYVVSCSFRWFVTPLYLYQCCVCGILFVPLVCYTFIFVLVLCMWYPVRSVGLCHLYICTSVVYVVSCSFRWFVSTFPLLYVVSCLFRWFVSHLYLYQCCVCGILFVPLVCYTFIFVLVLCMWYPVRSVGLCHLYICTSVVYVVSCSFRWFVTPLYLYQCCVCGILFVPLVYVTFIFVLMLWYPVRSVGLCHLYICTSVVYVVSCSFRWFVSPLYLYQCCVSGILFVPLVRVTFIFVLVLCMWYTVCSVGLCHLYICTSVVYVVSCSFRWFVSPLYLYQCCVCGILFVPLVCVTFIFVLVLCMWYPVRSVGSCHLYICTSVVFLVSCSFRWFVSPLYLYQCCVCGILFVPLVCNTFIFVLVLCMWYSVRSVGLCHFYICTSVVVLVSCSFRWFVSPLYLYQCCVCGILFALVCYTFIFVVVLCMWYPVRSVGLCRLYICTSVVYVVSCSFRWFVSPLYLYQCCVCGILFVPLVCYTFIFVLVLCMWYPVRSVGSCHLYICTSVVFLVSCSFRWFVTPLYLYQCYVCGILFVPLVCYTFIFVLVLCMWYPVRSVGSCHLIFVLVLCMWYPVRSLVCVTFIFVLVLCMWYPVRSVGLCHLYICTSVVYVVSCSFRWFVTPLYLYQCYVCGILFVPLVRVTFIFVCVSGIPPLSPLYLYQCCVCGILFVPLVCVTFIFVLVLCMWYACSFRWFVSPLYLYQCCVVLLHLYICTSVVYVVSCSFRWFVGLLHLYICTSVVYVVSCSFRWFVSPLYLYQCCVCGILFVCVTFIFVLVLCFWYPVRSVGLYTFIFVLVLCMWYPVRSVGLCHLYICTSVVYVVSCSFRWFVTPLYLYQCCVCGILFVPLVCFTFIFVIVLCMWYPVRSVGLLHLYICTSVVYVVSCWFRWFVSPLYLYQCCVCGMLFVPLVRVTFIFVLVLCFWYPVRSVGSCHLYICTSVVYVVYCSFRWFVTPLYLYQCCVCGILFFPLVCVTFIFVLVLCTWYPVRSVGLLHLYICTSVMYVVSCSFRWFVSPLYLYQCCVCGILFVPLVRVTFIFVLVLCIWYPVRSVGLLHLYICISVMYVVSCSFRWFVSPLNLYQSCVSGILFVPLVCVTFIFVLVLCMWYPVRSVGLCHLYICTSVVYVVSCSFRWFVTPLYLYQCCVRGILFVPLVCVTFIFVLVLCMWYPVRSVGLCHLYICTSVVYVVSCSFRWFVSPLYLYQCCVSGILFILLVCYTFIFVLVLCMWYLVRSVGLCHLYICTSVVYVVSCSFRWFVSSLYLYQCCVSGILFVPLVCYTFIFVLVLCMWYPVLSVGLCHLYICTSVVYVVSCSFRWFVTPLYLYQCCVCGILFVPLVCVTFIFVLVLCTWYPVRSVGLLHLYICTSVVYVVSCSFRWFVTPLYLYQCCVCGILFVPLVCVTFTFVLVSCMWYPVRSVGLCHLYICTSVVYVVSCSFRWFVSPLYLYQCCVCGILFVPLVCVTFIFVLVLCMWYPVRSVGLCLLYICTNVVYVVSCSFRWFVSPLYLYQCCISGILFVPLVCYTFIFVLVLCMWYPVRSVGLCHLYICTSVVNVVSCSFRWFVSPLYLYQCCVSGILFVPLICYTFIFVLVLCMQYPVRSVGLCHLYICTSVVYVVSCSFVGLCHLYICTSVMYVVSCSFRCFVSPLYLYQCCVCGILFVPLVRVTFIFVLVLCFWCPVRSVGLLHLYICTSVVYVVSCSFRWFVTPLYLYQCCVCGFLFVPLVRITFIFVLVLCFWYPVRSLFCVTFIFVLVLCMWYPVRSVSLSNLYICTTVVYVVSCSFRWFVSPLYLYQCCVSGILFVPLVCYTFIFVLVLCMWYPVRSVGLCHLYICTSVVYVVSCSFRWFVSPLYLYQCCVSGILFVPLVCYTFIFVLVLCMWYPVRSVGLYHFYICTSVVYVVSCSFRWFVSPLYLYQCCVSGILFVPLVCVTFIFVLVLCMWYPVRSVGLCHLYICTSVVYVVSCSFRWFVSPLYLYQCCVSGILFVPLVCYTFIFVLVLCMWYPVRSVGLCHLYICTSVVYVVSCSFRWFVSPLYLYQCCVCGILFVPLVCYTFIFVLVLCMWYPVRSVGLLHLYICTSVVYVVSCSFRWFVTPLYLYQCCVCGILFVPLVCVTFIFVLVLCMWYPVRSVGLLHLYICTSVVYVVSCSFRWFVAPLYLYQCCVCGILFVPLVCVNFIFVLVLCMWYPVRSVGLLHLYICTSVVYVVSCSFRWFVTPLYLYQCCVCGILFRWFVHLYLYQCCVCGILFVPLVCVTFIFVLVLCMWYPVRYWFVTPLYVYQCCVCGILFVPLVCYTFIFVLVLCMWYPVRSVGLLHLYICTSVVYVVSCSFRWFVHLYICTSVVYVVSCSFRWFVTPLYLYQCCVCGILFIPLVCYTFIFVLVLCMWYPVRSVGLCYLYICTSVVYAVSCSFRWFVTPLYLYQRCVCGILFVPLVCYTFIFVLVLCMWYPVRSVGSCHLYICTSVVYVVSCSFRWFVTPLYLYQCCVCGILFVPLVCVTFIFVLVLCMWYPVRSVGLLHLYICTSVVYVVSCSFRWFVVHLYICTSVVYVVSCSFRWFVTPLYLYQCCVCGILFVPLVCVTFIFVLVL